MAKEIMELLPKNVWRNFYSLTQIPRPSKKEARVIEFVKQFGRNLGLETITDEVGNVLIKKPASAGFENLKTIVLQAHLDMVPQKNSDSDHNFETDPIDAYIDGEWVKARGTTLGADNGIGAAAMMAVLESKALKHPAIEALFTIDEETDMTGAFHLKPDWLKGDILLNLDSEDEGELYIGCAGGLNTNIDYDYTTENSDNQHKAYRILVKGLKGGHSGIDIVLGRGNSIQLMARILYAIESLGMRLASFDGGSLRNAIPREASAIVTIPFNRMEKAVAIISELKHIIAEELSAAEPDLMIEFSETEMPVRLMGLKDAREFIRALYIFPNGVIRMSDYMPVPETSTNLAVAKAENGQVSIKSLQRSFVDTAKENLARQIRSVFELYGAKVVHEGSYPGWKPNPDSAILSAMKDVYHKGFGKIPEIKSIHAGLECGIIGGIYPKMDMISFGPTIRFPHSPDEKVNILSVEKFWDFLVKTLENAPSK